jgi:hypothetical protein
LGDLNNKSGLKKRPSSEIFKAFRRTREIWEIRLSKYQCLDPDQIWQAKLTHKKGKSEEVLTGGLRINTVFFNF